MFSGAVIRAGVPSKFSKISEVFGAGPETASEYIIQFSRRLRNSIMAAGDRPGLIFEVSAAGPETSLGYIKRYSRRLRIHSRSIFFILRIDGKFLVERTLFLEFIRFF